MDTNPIGDELQKCYGMKILSKLYHTLNPITTLCCADHTMAHNVHHSWEEYLATWQTPAFNDIVILISLPIYEAKILCTWLFLNLVYTVST